MPVSISQFFERLRESEVLAPEEVETLLNRVPANKRGLDAERVAAKLVEANKLTQYQAMALLEGRGHTLAMGDYVILHPIGAGGMGQVFKARHRRMKRTVALKILPESVTQDASAIKRFQREVEAAARLVHPNIVAAYDASEQKGIHYLVMEFVDGDDLANLVKKYGPLPVEVALSYVAQAAQGLAHAHQQGVIHRDIKPANLLLDSAGTVKILDLGLARFDSVLGEAGDGLTQTGSFMGTPDFMAPEQALNTKLADARADVYSLGCTLYYLLTGKKMYEGDTLMQRLVAHREQPIPALTNERDDLPADLSAVFERMVAKRPAERFKTMGEVAEAMAACRMVAVGVVSSLPKSRAGNAFASAAPPPLPPRLLPANTVSSQVDSGTHREPVSPHLDLSAPAATESWLKRLAKPDNSSRRRLLIGTACVLPVAALLLVAALLGRHLLPTLKSLPAARPGEAASPDDAQAGRSSDSGPQATPVTSGQDVVEEPSPPSKPVATPEEIQAASEARSSAQEARKLWLATAASSPAYLYPVEAGQAEAKFKAGEAAVKSNDHVSAASFFNTAITLFAVARRDVPAGEFENSLKMKLMYIPPGEFEMGSAESEKDRNVNEKLHRVRLNKAFYLGAHEVTLGQFQEYMRLSGNTVKTEAETDGKGGTGYNPAEGFQQKPTYSWRNSGFPQEVNHPVVNVSWNDAKAFCDWLSTKEGKKYRLPTEAEWEYACRAGMKSAYSSGGDDPETLDGIANVIDATAKQSVFAKSSGAKIAAKDGYVFTAPVGTYRPNAFGLFDMHGNATEWCADWYGFYGADAVDPIGPATGTHRMYRGGGYRSFLPFVRSAARTGDPPSSRYDYTGFRVACEP